MRNLDIARLVRLASAGTLAGMLVFLLFDPSMSSWERGRGFRGIPIERLESELITLAIYAIGMPACLAAFIGAFLLLADEIGSPAKRVLLRVSQAAIVGGVAGGVAGVPAQMLFTVFGIAARAFGPQGMLVIVVGRAFAWALIGGGGGLGIGYALGSSKRWMMSAMGGVAGGFVGGLVFDAIGMITQGGSVSRFVGFMIIGAAIGAAITIVEEVAKQSWITILSGPREGRTYIITRPVTTLGRDELADIPLYGDINIGKQHALLRLDGQAVTIESVAGQPLDVNSSPTDRIQLKDSDTIRIGRFGLRFHQKGTVGKAPAQQAAPPAKLTPPPPVPTTPSTGTLTLNILQGPYAGHSGQFTAGTVTIGREPGLQISLEHDEMISRRHAEITWDGSKWWVRDLGSSNGTYINGAPISSHPLCAGTELKVGQTVIRVDSV